MGDSDLTWPMIWAICVKFLVGPVLRKGWTGEKSILVIKLLYYSQASSFIILPESQDEDWIDTCPFHIHSFPSFSTISESLHTDNPHKGMCDHPQNRASQRVSSPQQDTEAFNYSTFFKCSNYKLQFDHQDNNAACFYENVYFKARWNILPYETLNSY